MADSEKVVILTAVLLLLGISYVAALRAFARTLLVALAVPLRVARADPAG